MDVRCSLKLILGIWKSSPEPPLLPLLVLNFFSYEERLGVNNHPHSYEDYDEKNYDSNDEENENNKDNNDTRKDSLLAE